MNHKTIFAITALVAGVLALGVAARAESAQRFDGQIRFPPDPTLISCQQ